MTSADWPALPYEGWRDTYATLHLWSQIVGKIALARAPALNHSWGVAFHVTPRGLTTQLLPYERRSFTIELNFIDHRMVIESSRGDIGSLALEPRTVADFYRRTMRLLSDLELPVRIWPVSVEMPTAIRLDEDTAHASYDREATERLWRVLSSIWRVLVQTRCDFVGKCSPVHFFWGGFDLAVTRFSGRRAPARDGPRFMQEAYSHEVISHGFWPGGVAAGAALLEPVLYGYAAPIPEGLADQRVEPEGAYWHPQLGEFILPYERVRAAPSPEDAIRRFVNSTYAVAAKAAKWDRAALERARSA